MLLPVTYPVSKVTGHVSGEASRGPNWSKVTCGDKVRHLYLWGDGQQRQITFVHVTIGRFLHNDNRLSYRLSHRNSLIP
jgi:hypothetical protein